MLYAIISQDVKNSLNKRMGARPDHVARLNQLKDEGWPQDMLDMMYMNEETSEWAKSLEPDEDAVVHLDSNGVKLEAGDTVILIKDLAVKGTSMVAKRGIAVRRISLDQNNPNHIEGKVDGQHIVILTQYVKKSK